ncbi:hypothetical protein L917_03445 [Phytophthora nicotianae]|uniref:RxLR effector protein n=1 Tax=Phytophthora nicotianae TaxID=4792 RepID=W2LSW5_PHYNI|nr:hypothetical protein L916_03530 [Phytophthora nicotianae]ETL99745.1 hypothetical protein L917_03445 [Phytophthora nicotianae]
MNLTFYCSVLIAVAVAHGLDYVAAENAATVHPTSEVESYGAVSEARYLRGRQKVDDEERVAVAGPAWYATHVMTHTSRSKLSTQNSQKILDAVKNDEPLPKWVKALVVLIGLGVVSGAAVAGVKITQGLLNTSNSKE